MTVLKYMIKSHEERRRSSRLLPVVPSARKRGNLHKWKHSRCHVDIKKHLFLYYEGGRSPKAVSPWSWLTSSV